tara:strand:- start:553 stop:882 length:330 start_codon:yes stop_codon:yes gene_type:complete
MALKKSSEARQQEHVNSTQFAIPFDGTPETCPYKTGDEYQGREVIAVGYSENVYGHSYHLIVERDRVHLRTKFVFDAKHDLKFTKPVERMAKTPDIRKYLPNPADDNRT